LVRLLWILESVPFKEAEDKVPDAKHSFFMNFKDDMGLLIYRAGSGLV
jgi:hypothetical protein